VTGFSTTRAAGAYCAICDQSNIFHYAAQTSQCRATITGSVNGLTTPVLPAGERYHLVNTVAGTCGAVELTVEGRQCRLVDDITLFNRVARPEDLRVAVGTGPVLPPPAPVSAGTLLSGGQPLLPAANRRSYVPIGQYSSARMPEQFGLIRAGDEMNALDVISETNHRMNPDRTAAAQEELNAITSVQAHPAAGPPPVLGACRIDTLAPGQEDWLVKVALCIIGPVEWANEVMGATYLNSAHGIDLTLTGTNLPGVVLETLSILLRGNKRAFLREMFGTGIGKVWVNSRGTVMVSFRGHSLARSFLTGTAYAASNAKTALVQTAVQTHAAPVSGALRSVASRIGVLSLGFVAFFNIAEWLADGEQDIHDLLASLAVDLFSVSVSIVAGALAGAVVIAWLPNIAIGVVLVAAGMGVGLIVGIVLDGIGRRFNLSTRIAEAMRTARINDLDPILYQGMMTAP
jgi:hypothetical protein